MFRKEITNHLLKSFDVHPVVAILGPRQCGKTTLVRHAIEEKVIDVSPEYYFDLEDAESLARLESNPKQALSALEGITVIDEIQRIAELFPTIRVIVDQKSCPYRYLILGSASRDLTC